MSAKYELNGNQVLRNGEPVANVNADGTVECTEAGVKFRPWIVKFLKNPAEPGDDDNAAEQPDPTTPPPDAAAAPAPGPTAPPPVQNARPAVRAVLPSIPKTTRELIAAMQPLISDRCPAMTRWEGDRTPAVLTWLKQHDDVRRQVLNGEVR